jgi:hypothetical protein
MGILNRSPYFFWLTKYPFKSGLFIVYTSLGTGLGSTLVILLSAVYQANLSAMPNID